MFWVSIVFCAVVGGLIASPSWIVGALAGTVVGFVLWVLISLLFVCVISAVFRDLK